MHKSVSRSHFCNQIGDLLGMSKLQMQETQHGEEDARGVEKSRPTRDLFALTPNRSSNVPSSSSTLHSWREQE